MCPFHGKPATGVLPSLKVAVVAPLLVTSPEPATERTCTATPPRSQAPLSSTPTPVAMLTPFPPGPASFTVPPLLMASDWLPLLPWATVRGRPVAISMEPPVLLIAVTFPLLVGQFKTSVPLLLTTAPSHGLRAACGVRTSVPELTMTLAALTGWLLKTLESV